MDEYKLSRGARCKCLNGGLYYAKLQFKINVKKDIGWEKGKNLIKDLDPDLTAFGDIRLFFFSPNRKDVRIHC